MNKLATFIIILFSLISCNKSENDLVIVEDKPQPIIEKFGFKYNDFNVHNDTIRKFALSKGFDYDKEGGAHRFGVYTNTLRTRPDKVGHDSAGRPYNKKADGSQGGWFSGSTGNTTAHTDADWAEHEKARDALNAAGTASGMSRR